MHELSLSQNMLAIALETPGAGKDNLRALNVKVGALSCTSTESLKFCLGMLLEEEGLEEVSINIEEVPARVRCECGYEGQIESLFVECPRCEGFERTVLEGQDVTLESIEVDNGED
jgi:hydrogenase nickel incorporation protein HypA/HybF